MTCIPLPPWGDKRGRGGWLCVPEEPESNYTKVRELAPQCPNTDNHTPEPRGYTAWFAWASKMGRTHRATRCPNCGLFTIWVPIVRRGPRGPYGPRRKKAA